MNEDIAKLISTSIARRVFPGAVVAYARAGERTVLPFGCLTYDASAEKVREETVYDVASVTKSVATGCIVMKLVERGELSLDDKVIRFIPELACRGREQILVRHLLTYTATFDLPKRMSAYALENGGHALLEMVFAAPLQAAPGARYVYSNAPAVLLGLIIERVVGPLDIVADEFFFEPLGMHHTTFHPRELHGASVAPTEINARGEVKGIVHDESAWALQNAGIIAGNAGLFSTANDLLTFGEMLLAGGTYNGRTYFETKTVAQMRTNQTIGIGARAGFGWDVAQPRYMGAHFSPECFGKCGFTGVTLLVEPKKNVVFVLLSNRTYPKRSADDAAINDVRRRLADTVLL